MPWVIAGGALAGGLLSGAASESAAQTQADAARAAGTGVQQRFDTMRSDLTPYRTSGVNALNMLSQLLGIAPTPGARTATPMPDIAQFTRSGGRVEIRPGQAGYQGPGLSPQYTWNTPTIDYAGYDQAVKDWQASQGGDAPPGQYGALLKPFTGADLASEPGYQFGLQQGTAALDQSAVANGGLLSGNALKAITRYGTDYGGTKYNEAFQRDLANKQNTYNMLTGVSNAGQNAATQTGVAGIDAANTAGSFNTSGAASQAAGTVGVANALNNTIGTLTNQYQQNRLINAMSPSPTGATGNVFPVYPTYGSPSELAGYYGYG